MIRKIRGGAEDLLKEKKIAWEVVRLTSVFVDLFSTAVPIKSVTLISIY